MLFYKHKSKIFLTVVLLLGLLFVALSGVSGADGPVTGAIWTTDVGGTINQNIYDSKEDVYLNGGPVAPGSNGLPDGDYYWKVTKPNGTYLGGSGDTTFAVVDGRFVSNFNLWDYNPTESNFGDSSNGEYKVWISQNPAFPPNESKTDNFRVKSENGGGGGAGTFGSISGMKFYDANTDGDFDPPEEVPIGGWRIELFDATGTLLEVRYTTTDTPVGQYSFEALDPGTYTVAEVFPDAGWINTTPTTRSVTLDEGEDETNIDFGNVCLGGGGGKTLGFWSNKNGFATLNDGGTIAPELALLVGLNLRNANGTNYDPTAYPGPTGLRAWLLNATATNMAYMLSVQLAAMELNVEAGFVSGDSLVFAPGWDLGDPSDNFATVTELMGAADAALGADGLTLAGDEPNRSYQELLKNALDDANNNLVFVHSGPCSFTTPY